MLLSLESEFLNLLNYLSLLKLKTRAHIEIDSLKTAGGQTHRGTWWYGPLNLINSAYCVHYIEQKDCMYGWVRCRGYIRNSLYKINQVTSRHSGRTVQVRASLVYLLYERNPCYIQIPTTVQLYKAEEKSLFFHINCVCVLLYPEEYTCSFLENFTVLHSDPASQVFFI